MAQKPQLTLHAAWLSEYIHRRLLGKEQSCTALLEMKQHTLTGNNCPKPKKWITETLKPGKIRRGKKNRGNSLILQYRVVYMHISWFSHTGHTTVRPWRPKPLLKGLSSKAGDKITHRLRVLSRAGLLTVTRLCCVPQAVSTTLQLCDSSALPFPCNKFSRLSYIHLHVRVRSFQMTQGRLQEERYLLFYLF